MISVCMTTYNGGKYIEQQLKSVLSELSLLDEIIISDDGSSDETLTIIKSFQDDRIKIYDHSKEKIDKAVFKFDFTTRNMENAISMAVGDFIFMVDQDDIWEAGRVNTILPLLQDYDLVVSDCKVVNDNLEIIHDSYYKLVNSKKGVIKNLAKNSYLGCCMAFNVNILKYALPFPKEAIPHDIWLGIISELYGNVYFTNTKTILYRRHENNVSNSAEISTNSLSFKIRYRLLFVIALIKRMLKTHK